MAVVAVLAAAVIHIFLQAGMMWAGWHPNSFRNYYSPDQLVYLSISLDVARDESWMVEPMTLTGTSYYPRAWYVLLGYVSDLLNVSPAAAWTVGGLAVQVLLVCAVGSACVLLSRRWWTGFLGFVPFVVGTGAWILGSGEEWQTPLRSHATLWGPFGILFALNGETVALSLSGIALLAVLVTAAGRIPERAQWPVGIVASLVVGLLSVVQTYAFFTATFLLVMGTATVALVRQRSRGAALVSAALLLVVIAAGPAVADAVSPLAVLALGLSPALPGLWIAARLTGWRVAWCAVALGIGALPQVGSTAYGLANDDPFLVFRQASSKDLGVPLGQGLFAGAAVLVLLTLILVVGLWRRRVLWIAVPATLAGTWVLLASNDRWGVNQEPYRFWLEICLLSAVLLVPLAAWAAVDGFANSAVVPGPADRPIDAHHGVATAPWSLRARVVLGIGLSACVVVGGLWSYDFVLFRSAVKQMGYISLDAEQYTAQAQLAERTDGGLVLPDGCIDPWLFKATWGGPVATYHPGLAFPAHRQDLDLVSSARTTGELDLEAAQRANVRWVLRDPACPVDIRANLPGNLVGRVQLSDGGSRELWKIDFDP